MSADFWAGYLSGAIGILVGNPLDLIKTRLQAGPQSKPTATASLNSSPPKTWHSHFTRLRSFAQGAAAPILGYGALNALLFVTYNRSLALLHPSPDPSEIPIITPSIPGWRLWTAGALAGLATFPLSTPTELLKCRVQLLKTPRSTLSVARSLIQNHGPRILYLGGVITALRDAVGYGFYFWSYEASKRALTLAAEKYDRGPMPESDAQSAIRVLLCGGVAGVVTWASVFPLDVIKTRVQTQELVFGGDAVPTGEQRPLLRNADAPVETMPRQRLVALQIARQAYQTEGIAVFFRGLGVCSVRAFIVNAVQWAVYEWVMQVLAA